MAKTAPAPAGDTVLPFPGRGVVHEVVVAGDPAPWHVLPVVRGTTGELLAMLRKGRRPTAGLTLEGPSERYQIRIARAAHKVLPRQLRGALRVEVVLVHARPKRLRNPERTWHATAPDVDKVLRNVLDGLQRGPTGKPRGRRRPRDARGKPLPWPGVIGDDALVCSVVVEDWYAAADEDPHTVVRIMELS